MHVFVMLCLKILHLDLIKGNIPAIAQIVLCVIFVQNPNKDKKDKIPYFCIVVFFPSHTLPLSLKMFKVMCWLRVKLYPRWRTVQDLHWSISMALARPLSFCSEPHRLNFTGRATACGQHATLKPPILGLLSPQLISKNGVLSFLFWSV